MLESLVLLALNTPPAAGRIQIPAPYALVLQTELGVVTNPSKGEATYCGAPGVDGWKQCVQTYDPDLDWVIDRICIYDEDYPLSLRNYQCFQAE